MVDADSTFSIRSKAHIFGDYDVRTLMKLTELTVVRNGDPLPKS